MWSIDGYNNYATMHIVTDADGHHIKDAVREELAEHNIEHVTLELETADEHCHHKECYVKHGECGGHHHHHHHH